ncbi:hypothetical protein LAZ67_2001032 [Cordylochernes scorpioides]|uniref:ABC transporter domain-containing protein n=1 Tax=Cordylochernes scorpioides TaxID=51811 RepID=A0ABY6K4E8_9ARAC|nr:hypothetical protein LAZ67_2001032 [Cordylochernes scorpioides]
MIQTGCAAEEGELIASDNGCGTSVVYKIKRTEGECPQGDIQSENSTPGIFSEILHENSNDRGELQCDSVADFSDSVRLSGTTAAIQLDGTELDAPWKCDKARWSKHPEVGAGNPTERDRALDALWKSDDNVCDAEVARNVSAPSSAMQAEKMCQECVPFIFVPSPDKVQIKQPPPTKSSTDLETATGSDTSRRFKKFTALCVVGTKEPRFEGLGKRESLEQENVKPKEEKGGHEMDSVDQVDESTVKIGDLQPRRGRKRRKRITNDHNPLYIVATECSQGEFKISDGSIVGSEIWPPSCGEPPPCARQRDQSMASALVESGKKARVEMWFCKQGLVLTLPLRFREADDPHVARDVREIKGPPISASGEISLFGTKRIEKGAVKRCSREIEEKTWGSQERRMEVPNISHGQVIFPPYQPLEALRDSSTRPLSELMVLYTPNTSKDAEDIMKKAGNKLGIPLQGFPTEDEMVESYLTSPQQAITVGAVTFQSINPYGEIIFKVRPKATPAELKNDTLSQLEKIWFTDYVYSLMILNYPRHFLNSYGAVPTYAESGFLALQESVTSAIIEWKYEKIRISRPQLNVKYLLKRFPYPPFIVDTFLPNCMLYLPVFIIFSFLYPNVIAVWNIVQEKETRVEEAMKIMGLISWVNWLAIFTKELAIFSFNSLIITAILKIQFRAESSVFRYSDFSLIFVILLTYSICTISLSFLISAFFSSSSTAAAASGVVFLINFLPYFMIISNYSKWSYVGIVAICILPNTAISMIFKLLTSWEGNGEGAQWHLISQTPIFGDPMNIRVILQTMIIDSVVCLVLALYINEVFPRKYAYYKSLFFPFHFLRKYIHKEGPEEFMETLPLDDERFESEPASVPGIKCVGLTKSYGERISVNNLYLNCHMGQITVLLGHNGAGKTTTMSMITGMISPTYGTVFINTYNIKTHVGKIRSNLGICPQYNVLFDNLTVYDHLYFFRKLKICSNENLKEDIDIMIQRLDLENKRNSFPRMLSGGMKRKLSIGNALIGDPSVVLLDEPSSGMDPSARRFIWDLLTEEKKGRTILLTTQFMEEADILGDRIAIMDRGMIQCCGSPLFLKKQYGVGYHMVLVKDISCDTQIVLKAVQNFVSNAEIESNMGQELSITLPTDSVIKFESLFTYLEENKKELGIQSYGASVTTLEEVFLKVGEHAMSKMKYIRGEELRAFEEVRLNNQMKRDLLSTNIIRGIRLKWRHFRTLAWKKFLFVKRHIMMTFIQQILPSILIIISFSSLIDLSDLSKVVPVAIDINMFDYTYAPYLLDNTTIIKQLVEDNLQKVYTPETIFKALDNRKYTSIDEYLLYTARTSTGKYNTKYITAISAKSTGNNDIELIILFQTQAMHNAPIALWIATNLVNNYYFSDKGSSNLIQVINHPLPETVADNTQIVFYQENSIYQLCQGMGFAVSLLLASFAFLPVQEKYLKSKHIQHLCGVKIVNYWSSTLLVDLLLYNLASFIQAVCVMMFQKPGLSSFSDFMRLIVVYCLCGFAGIPSVYILSQFYNDSTSAYIQIFFILVSTGIGSLLAVFVTGMRDFNLKWSNNLLDNVCSGLFPVYAFMACISSLYTNNRFKGICEWEAVQSNCNPKSPYFLHFKPCCPKYCGDVCLDWRPSYFAWEREGMGKYLTFMAVHFVGYTVGLTLTELTIWKRFREVLRGAQATCKGCAIVSNPIEDYVDEDVDVLREKDRILGSKLAEIEYTNPIIFHKLSKCYGNFTAVNELCLGIKRGEIFGLLGINGAGKSSTFKMIAGDEPITSGDIYIEGKSIKQEPSWIYSKIGYCPQYDALLETMTGRETMIMYGQIKGLPRVEIEEQIDNLSKVLYFEKHLNKLVRNYSGGSKRKLSTAIALMGDPPIILLDEPSSGMDPVARRCLWDSLLSAQNRGCSIILTSHSMEECEALCNRLVIMVNGHFCCLGSSQYLKNKYSEGFTLGIKVSPPIFLSTDPPEERDKKRVDFIGQIEELKNYIEKMYPAAILKAAHYGFLQYYISDTRINWAQIFGNLETARVKFNIEDYSKFKIQGRQKKEIITSILFALIFSVSLMLIRIHIPVESKPKVVYPSYETKSTTAFFKSFLFGISRSIIYAPNDEAAWKIMESVSKDLGIEVVGFENEEKMEHAYLYTSIQPVTLAGVVLHIQEESGQVRVKIRPRATPAPFHNSTTATYEIAWRSEFRLPIVIRSFPLHETNIYDAYPTYAESGVLAIQESLTRAIWEWRLQFFPSYKPVSQLKLSMERFPYPNYKMDDFIPLSAFFIPLFMLFSFIYPAITSVKDIVRDKETKVEEAMRIMGLMKSANWAAIFCKELFLFSITSILISIVLTTNFKDGLIVFSQSSVFLVVLIFLGYSILIISLSFLISSFFQSSGAVTAATGLIFLATFYPYFKVLPEYSKWSYGMLVAVCFLPNTAFAILISIIACWESAGSGLQWDNIGRSPNIDSSLTILTIMEIMFFESIIFILIGYFISNLPSNWLELAQIWYSTYIVYGHAHRKQNTMVITESNIDENNFEKEPDTPPGIRCIGLTKFFCDKLSVNNIYLNCHVGQITVLLGHNGAGKSTTMSMIAGSMPPTYGTAFIAGKNVRTEMNQIRKDLGICPQYNILFDHLTVYEHLEFFVKLKHKNHKYYQVEIEKLLQKLDLESKQDDFPPMLSGGMRRKLSIGNALIGYSKIVLLDEPTSGMDPSARRFIWDLLLQEKNARTVLLTTQYMEEADILGDRIAIMDRGTVKCCGSPLFLKKKYGIGYHLIMVKEPSCDVNVLLKSLQNIIPELDIESNIGQELCLILPTETIKQYEALFTYLEANMSNLGIQSYGASLTTLEEVFLKVGDEANQKLNYFQNSRKSIRPIRDKDISNQKVEGKNLIFNHFKALIRKKIIFSKRNRIMTFCQQILPAFLLILTFVLMVDHSDLLYSPAREISNKLYGPTTVIIYKENNSEINSILNDHLKKLFAIGTEYKYVDTKKYKTIEDYLIQMASKDIGSYVILHMVAFTFKRSNAGSLEIKCLFNTQGFHNAPFSLWVAMNLLNNFYFTPNSSVTDFIPVTIQPLPGAISDSGQIVLFSENTIYQICQGIGFSVSFLLASFAYLPVLERSIKSRQIQHLCGARAYVYWISIILVDMGIFLMASILQIIIILFFQKPGLSTIAEATRLFVPFLFLGISAIPSVYVLSQIFKEGTSAYGKIVFILIVTGIGSLITISVTGIDGLGLENISKSLDLLCGLVFPVYAFMGSIWSMVLNYQFKTLCQKPIIQNNCDPSYPFFKFIKPCCRKYCENKCLNWKENYFDFEKEGMGKYLLFMFLQSIFYYFLLAITEMNLRALLALYVFNRKCISKANPRFLNTLVEYVEEDIDVLRERDRIFSSDFKALLTSERIIFMKLTKNYGSFTAVSDLCLGIRPGEIFGLLGVNGAGKSTIFKMLTGDLTISSGDAYIVGVSVKTNPSALYSKIGYCPQYDAILDTMTGREALFMYGKLKGMTTMKIEDQIFNLSRMLYFEHHLDKIIKYYSGGNKRKLSSAIALIGYPPVVFLDEPSSGMDPIARRCLWETLLEFQKRGCSILLTSHSMEECEVLCNRLVIMVNGHFCCLGPPQHLKNKYSEGFTLGIKLSHPVIYSSYTKEEIESKQAEFIADIEEFKDYIEDLYPNAILKAAHCGFLQYHIKSSSLKWGDLFGSLERAKLKFNIEDYSLSQTTLEQIFLSLAKAQK